MRGFPPAQLAFLIAVYLVIGWPLVKLTSGPRELLAEEQTGSVSTTRNADARTVWVRIRSTAGCEDARLLAGDADLLGGAGLVEGEAEFETELKFENDGIELRLEASWGSESRQVVTVEVEPDNLERRSETLWTEDGQLDDLLEYQWK
jgi:hypothetical protein